MVAVVIAIISDRATVAGLVAVVGTWLMAVWTTWP